MQRHQQVRASQGVKTTAKVVQIGANKANLASCYYYHYR